MTFPAPFRSSAQRVEDQWIDYNGHFNMAYYTVIFDRAADEAFAVVGLSPAYVKSTNNSFFTLEAHISYLRELQANDTVIVETQFLDADHKRVHYAQRMLHEKEGWLACVLEVIVSHVDLAAKKTSPFPADMQNRVQQTLEAHQPLPVPPQVGHKIGIPRKV